jgi:glycosyltransferase involved in cell wall biosynthesis
LRMVSTKKKSAIVSVINDLVSDNRVNRICMTLKDSGYEVTLIGRKLPGSPTVPAWPFASIRMNLLFKKGPLFYLFFNLRLFFVLLFKKADLLYANDLDTLLPNYILSKIKNLPLIYDSHELFCEVPELQQSPLKKKIWESLEHFIVPQLKYCITVSEGIADIYFKKYKVKFHVVRNIPVVSQVNSIKTRKELGLPEDKKIILLQGAGININRGAEELMEAMLKINNVLLLIIGSGDVWEALQQKRKHLHLEDKVLLINRLPKEALMHYTVNADLGLSIDKSDNPNYYNSLPNKLFDYIHAGIPVLASRLPEIEKIIKRFNIGTFIESHDPLHIASKIADLLVSAELDVYKGNTDVAKAALNWEVEKQVLTNLINHAV